MAFRHVVMFRFADDASEEQRRALARGLDGMPSATGVVRPEDYRHGFDAGINAANGCSRRPRRGGGGDSPGCRSLAVGIRTLGRRTTATGLDRHRPRTRDSDLSRVGRPSDS